LQGIPGHWNSTFMRQNGRSDNWAIFVAESEGLNCTPSLDLELASKSSLCCGWDSGSGETMEAMKLRRKLWSRRTEALLEESLTHEVSRALITWSYLLGWEVMRLQLKSLEHRS
jgi:hypothetical protein